MSYEVYVDVRHHPRHLEDWEKREQSANRFVWEDGQDPMPLVAGSLRGLADRLSPETHLDADARRVWVALDNEVQRVRREWESSPNSQRAILGSLFRVADALGLGEEFLPGVRAELNEAKGL